MPVLTCNEERVILAMVGYAIQHIVYLIIVIPFDSMLVEILLLNLKQLAQVEPLFNLTVKIE